MVLRTYRKYLFNFNNTIHYSDPFPIRTHWILNKNKCFDTNSIIISHIRFYYTAQTYRLNVLHRYHEKKMSNAKEKKNFNRYFNTTTNGWVNVSLMKIKIFK